MKPVVLIVDDEDLVRDFVRMLLRQDGYPTLEAPDAIQALKLLADNPGVAVLLTDIDMPGMDGFVLADTAVRRLPHLRVIYTSGHADLSNSNGSSVAIHGELLRKPYASRDLSAAIDHALRKFVNPPTQGSGVDGGERPRRI
jgi:DNA-binding NtrC family response regulator